MAVKSPVRRTAHHRSAMIGVATYVALMAAIKDSLHSGLGIPCAGREANGELWFAEEKRQESRAKQLCRSCPVIVECARHALRNDEVGVWGGMTRNERHKVRREAFLASPR